MDHKEDQMEHGQEINFIVRDWFAANFPLIYFVYGLAFFVLGLSISLQSRQYSRLNLARSLSWLAAFGILHGLNEWGDVFIPIQAQFLNEFTIMVLHSIHYIVLALSFAFLFQFGIELFRPFTVKMRWLRMVPMVVFITWLTVPYALGFKWINDFDKWSGLVTSLARYSMCIPGSILSGLGLIKQANLQFNRLKLKNISKTLKVAAVSLFAYAFFSGMVVNPSFYFPANVLNTQTFEMLFIFPPVVFRSIIGLILAISIIRTLEVFNIETDRLIRRMEEGEVISIERTRIARDIHDGALQQVYAAGLLAQSLRKKVGTEHLDSLNRLISMVNQAIDQLRAFLPQLNPTVHEIELLPALIPVIEEARKTMPVNINWDNDLNPSLKPEQIAHLIALTREAMSNAIRHSRTDKIEISLTKSGDYFQVSIRDFGKGMPVRIDEGYGLRNMHDRARLLGAEIHFDSVPGKGTTVRLDFPVGT